MVFTVIFDKLSRNFYNPYAPHRHNKVEKELKDALKGEDPQVDSEQVELIGTSDSLTQRNTNTGKPVVYVAGNWIPEDIYDRLRDPLGDVDNELAEGQYGRCGVPKPEAHSNAMKLPSHVASSVSNTAIPVLCPHVCPMQADNAWTTYP